MFNTLNNKPSKRQAVKTMLLALVGFIAANFTDRFLLLFVSFYEYHPNVLIFSGALQIIGNILLAALISQYLYKSSVVLRTQGPNKKNIASISLGVLLFIVMFGGQLMAAVAFKNANNYFVTSEAESAERFQIILNSKLAPSKLSKLSFLYAQHEYEYNGELIEYKTEDGRSLKYEPTDESRKSRSFIMMSGLYYRLEPKIRAISTAIWGLMALGTLLYILYKPDKGNTTPS
jgi:ABC-type multidrug transport system fused ATPase/permease subunit